MSYLVDTNVISELRKPKPEPKVIAWFKSVKKSQVQLSGVTLGEIAYGIGRAQPAQREKLSLWLEWIKHDYQGRMLGLEPSILELAGRLTAESENTGKQLEAMDSLIAATCIIHSFTLVTRNTADFLHLPVSVLNPWIG
jgi:toxin FitB